MRPPAPELERLVAAYLASRASAEEVAQLAERLRTDAAARDYYLDTAEVHAGLALDESLWAQPAGDRVVPMPKPEPFARARGWKLARLAAAIVACLALGVLWGVKHFSQVARPGIPGAGEPRPAIAVLARAVEAQWGGAASNLQEAAELRVGTLELLRGTAQVDFYSGVRLVLVGPARLEIRSAREAHLERGKATCEVDEQGRGFRLSAPGTEVVDLGTVFGLKVPANGQTEVHVLEGKVAVGPPGGRHYTELGKSQAVRRLENALEAIAFAPNEFPRSADLKRSEDAGSARRLLAWRDAAAALDRDPAVLVHFAFHEEAADGGGVARNLAQSAARGSDGMVIGARLAEGRWPGKRALEFRGRGDRVLLRVPGAHDSLTVAAWLRVDAYQELVTALLVTEESRRWQGLENGQPPVALAELPYLPLRWELRNDGQLALNWQRADRSAGKGWHIHWANTDLKPGRLGTWTLLATVVDGARREVVHYVNGREVGRRPAMIESPFALTRLCLGNMSSTEAEAKAGIRYGFFGRMDEVIVANRAFGAGEIARLYEIGKP